jgi:hypothetical protein
MSFRLFLAQRDKLDLVLEDFLADKRYDAFAFREAPSVEDLTQRLFVTGGLLPALAVDAKTGQKLTLLGLVLDDGPPYFEYIELEEGLDPDLLRAILVKFLYLVFKAKRIPRVLYYLDADEQAEAEAFIEAGFERVASQESALAGEIVLLLERDVFAQLHANPDA